MLVAFGKLPFAMSSGQQQSGVIAVSYVYWYKPANVNDTFILQDGSGNLVLAGNCENAGQSQWFNFSGRPVECNGLGVGQLSSGTLYIYPA